MRFNKAANIFLLALTEVFILAAAAIKQDFTIHMKMDDGGVDFPDVDPHKMAMLHRMGPTLRPKSPELVPRK
jgi:hypothetical protein